MTDARSQPLQLHDMYGFEEALGQCVSDPFWATYVRSAFSAADARPRVHLAVFVEPFLTLLLDGTKTVESRFSVNRVAPYKQVSAGDLLLLKRSSGPVVGLAIADEPAFYELDRDAWDDVRTRFARAICATPGFWESKRSARFGTLIPVRDVREIRPLVVQKRDRRGWVILDGVASRRGVDLRQLPAVAAL